MIWRSRQDDVQVTVDDRSNPRPLDLENGLRAGVQRCPVHLADGRGSERFLLELGKDLVHGSAQLGRQQLLDQRPGNRHDIVLQTPQFGDELRRQQIIARGHQLTELDEGDAGLLKGSAQRTGKRDVSLVIAEARPRPDLPGQSVACRDRTYLGISAGTGRAVLNLLDPGDR